MERRQEGGLFDRSGRFIQAGPPTAGFRKGRNQNVDSRRAIAADALTAKVCRGRIAVKNELRWCP
jgi:hypothetical protein